MVSGDSAYKGSERRVEERRIQKDRRTVVRFEDSLGRRSGVERRVVHFLKEELSTQLSN